MNRSVKPLLGALAVTLALTAAACGGKDLKVSANSPWEILPADVVGVIHVDMKALTAAEMFQSMNPEFQALVSAPLGMLAGMEADTGFNFLTDIDSITMGGIMENGEEGPYFVVVKGRFDVDRLTEFAEGSSYAHALDLDGVTAFDTINPNNPMEDSPSIGWLDETTLLVSSPTDFPFFMKAVAGEIDTVADTPLAQHAAAARNHVFAVFDVPGDAFAAPEAAMVLAMAPPLQELKTVRVGLDVDDGLDLSVSAMSGTEAGGQALESMLQSFMGMGQMMAKENPEAAAALASLNLSRSGKTVQISMRVSGDEVRTAMQQVSPMMLAQFMPGAGGGMPGAGGGMPTPGATPDTTAMMAGNTELEMTPAGEGSGDAEDGDTATDSVAEGGTSDGAATDTVTYASRRPHGPTVPADRYESAIGSWVRITDTSGIEMKVKLTGVDDDTITFEKRVSGGAMVMSLERADVASMTLVRPT